MKDNKGKCKFGDSCRFMHPVKCKNIREKGKCDDNECKLFHFKKPRTSKPDGAKKDHSGAKKDHSGAKPVTKDSEGNNNGKSPNRENKNKPVSSEDSFLGESQMELFLDKFMDFVKNRKMIQEKQTQLDNFSQLLTQMTQS